nr:uncharacterized protein LOC109162687 [Ipomoea trifida]
MPSICCSSSEHQLFIFDPTISFPLLPCDAFNLLQQDSSGKGKLCYGRDLLYLMGYGLSVCLFTSDPDFCYDVVFVPSAIPDEIDPTRIFHISLLSSLDYLSELVDIPKSMISGLDSETRFVLRECEFMFVFAQSQLNESVARLQMEKSEYGKMLGVDKLVWDLQSFISEAQGQVKRCTKWLESAKSPMDSRIEVNTEMAERVMTICQEMLANRKDILDMFYPRISSVVSSLVLNCEYEFSVFLFCSQYLVLIFLCCLLFRLMVGK